MLQRVWASLVAALRKVPELGSKSDHRQPNLDAWDYCLGQTAFPGCDQTGISSEAILNLKLLRIYTCILSIFQINNLSNNC